MVMTNTKKYTTRQNKKYKRHEKKSYNVTREVKGGEKKSHLVGGIQEWVHARGNI